MAASSGALGRIAFEPGSGTPTFDGSSERIAFLSESLSESTNIIHSDMIFGTRSFLGSKTRLGTRVVGGQVVLEPSQKFFEDWLDRVLGASPSLNDPTTNITRFDIAETLPEFAAKVDKRGSIYIFQDGKCNSMTLSGSDSGNGLLQCTLDLMFKTSSGGSTWDATIPDIDAAPLTPTAFEHVLAFHDCVVTIEGTTPAIHSFSLSVNNNLDALFFNSRTVTEFLPTRRDVLFECVSTFSSTEYTNLVGNDEDGTTGSLVITPSGLVAGDDVNINFDFQLLHIVDVTPVIGGPGEITLALSGRVTSDGTETSASSGIFEDIFVLNDQEDD